MAVDFGNNNNSAYYSVADSSGLTFPNGQWWFAFWARIDDNTGSAFQYLISNGGFLATSSFNIFLGEASASVYDGQWSLAARDGSGNYIPGQTDVEQMVSTGSSYADGVDRLYVFQRTSSRFEFWSCTKNGTATLEDYSDDLNSVGAIDGGAWNIGRRTDGNSDRYFEEHAGEIAFTSGASLSQAQIEAMAVGTQTVLQLGHSPEAYWPLTDSDDTTDAAGNSHTLTENGTVGDSGFQFITAATGALSLNDLTNHRIYQRSGRPQRASPCPAPTPAPRPITSRAGCWRHPTAPPSSRTGRR
jgi:hypothetical protein